MNIWRRVISEGLSFLVSTVQQVRAIVPFFFFHLCAQWIVTGCAIVTLDKAFLFTDGRYFLQAENQLDELSDTILVFEILTLTMGLSAIRNWTLMKQGLPGI